MIKTIISAYFYLALLGDMAIIVVVVMALVKIFGKVKYLDKLKRFLAPKSYSLAFLLSLIATLASLFLSEVARLQPCILCWYQRIFMYPQPLLYYIGLIRREKVLKPYLLTINIIGAAVAAYHYLLQIMPRSVYAPCSSDLSGVSCIKGYKFYFGFMSFPLMSMTVFILLIILLLFSKEKR